MEQLRETVFLKIYLLIPVLFLSSCTLWSESDVSKISPYSCVIIFDAGSSGTRLYLYTRQDASWREHKGPKVSPFADPVREIHGKTWFDREEGVTSEIATALDLMAEQTYDWRSECELSYFAVYATAGMRLTEAENRLVLGKDESPKTLGFPPSCRYGAGEEGTDWSVTACTESIVFQKKGAIVAPYNFTEKGQGTYEEILAASHSIDEWLRLGDFKYIADRLIDTCCRKKGDCQFQKHSCFRVVYYRKFLQELGIPLNSLSFKTR